MTRAWPDRMLVLDFSGTLSLEAALFARDESLARALRESGLWQAGVDSREAFWDGIVNPTWQEGSTTAIGYAQLLLRHLLQMAESRGESPCRNDLLAAASRFVEAYLRHSPIDPTWGQALHRLLRHPGLVIVVATDHYAEATAHIVGQLTRLGLAGAPALEARAERVLVANSADLGYRKATERFWAALQAARGLALERVALVDDFGAHEQPLDGYARPQDVARRREAAVQAITNVFAAPTSVFPFLLDSVPPPSREPGDGTRGTEREQEALRPYRMLVGKAGDFVARELALVG